MSSLPSGSTSRAIPKPLAGRDRQQAWWLVAGLVGVCLLAYFNSLRLVASSWGNPQYSHGFLVPLGTLALLWMKRKPFCQVASWERWLGVALLLLATLMRVVSAYLTRFTPDFVSLLPCLLGVFLLVGGVRSLRWAALPILFLVFMFPWPDSLERLILANLKSRIAMPASLFALQTLGVESYLSGDVIELGDGTRMNVVDACAGLDMLNIFRALAAGFAMVVTWRPAWERVVLFISAVPIALAANVLRITVEGLIFYYGTRLLSPETLTTVANAFHDHLSSWFMMGVALSLLYGEYQLLTRLFIEEDSHDSIRRHLNVSAEAGR